MARPRTAMASCVAAALLLCSLQTGWSKTPEVTRFALVIGNNQPEPHSELAVLRYADDDALGMAALLREAGVVTTVLARPDSQSRQLHPDRQGEGAPTLAAVRRSFKELAQRMRNAARRGQQSEFLLFYSGHGDVARGEGYLVLEDGRLTRSWLYEHLIARSPARVNHVIIDACKAYYLALGKGPGGRRQRYRGPAFAAGLERNHLANTGFVLSSSSSRDSHEWEEYQAGIFTHEMRSALRGAADVNGDRAITYAEIGAFLSAANGAIANPRFRPDFVILAPGSPPRSLSRPILGWPAGSGALILGPGPLGHVYLETATGERLLDVHPKPDQSLVVQLPRQRPLYLRSSDGKREQLITRTTPTRAAQFGPGTLVVARKGALHVAFRSLFSRPFGRADVTAFEQGYRQGGEAAIALDVRDTADSGGNAARLTRSIAGWTAIGAGALGLGLQLWAFERQSADQDAPQAERPAINDSIRRLNISAIACYSIAAVAGITWLALRIIDWRARRSKARVANTPVFHTKMDPSGFRLTF